MVFGVFAERVLDLDVEWIRLLHPVESQRLLQSAAGEELPVLEDEVPAATVPGDDLPVLEDDLPDTVPSEGDLPELD